MRSSTFLAAVAAGLLLSTAALADGAIAIGGGSFGFSRNHPNMDVATSVALGNCGNSSCHVVLTFRNACAAFAKASNGASGWAFRGSEGAARERAVENCMAQGGTNCTVRTNLGYECDGY